MKTQKRLPFVLAFTFALVAGACSDIDFSPRPTDGKDGPVILPPPPPRSTVANDTVTVG